MLKPNQFMHKFLEHELSKDTNKLSNDEKEALARDQAKKMLSH